MKFATATPLLCLLFTLWMTACQTPDIQPLQSIPMISSSRANASLPKPPGRTKTSGAARGLDCPQAKSSQRSRALFDAAMPAAGQILQTDASTRMAQSLFSPENVKGFHGNLTNVPWAGFIAA